MNTKVNRALGGPAAAEEARTREEVRRRLATTREQARRRHDQTLHRLARLLRANEPRKPALTVLAGHGMGLATAMLAGTVVGAISFCLALLTGPETRGTQFVPDLVVA